jgi:hypothetical protein
MNLMSPLTKLEPFEQSWASRPFRKLVGIVKKTFGISVVLFFSSMWVASGFVALNLIYSWMYGINIYLKWFDIWMLIEAGFLIFQNIKYRIFRTVNSDHLPKMSDEEYECSLKEMIHDNDSPAEFISGWFFGAPIESITRYDVSDWLAGTFWNTHIDQVTAHQSALISKWIDSFEKKVGIKFSNPGNRVCCLRKIVLTRDPVKIYHKPLIHYSAVRVANFSAWITLSAMGFQKYKGIFRFQVDQLGLACPFFYRKVEDPKQMPLVFFHGLGIGINCI